MYKRLCKSNKLIYILILLLLITVSCNKQETTENTIYQYGLINEDFVIQKDTTYIQLGNTLEKTEIAEEVISMRDINEKKAYQTIAYDGFVLLVAPSTGKGDVIFQIITISSTFQTYREVKVGDNISVVFERYGEDYKMYSSEDFTFYRYTYSDIENHRYLFFETDEDGSISRIAFGLT